METASQGANVARYYFEPAQLAPDTFQVVRFRGTEGLSQLFQFSFELLSTDPDIDFAQIVNKPATFTMMREGEPTPINGIVTDFSLAGRTKDHIRYRATLQPTLWRLSLSYRSRIFQEMTVEEILRRVLEEDGLMGSDFRFALSESYSPREYCVQHEETDLNFVKRLMEFEGIYFFFEHKEGRDVLVMTDTRSEHSKIEVPSALQYHTGAGEMIDAEEESVRDFVCKEQIVTGKVQLKDYNYRTPETMTVESQLNGEMPGTRYEYGEHFRDAQRGERLAKVRNEEIEARRRVMEGDSNSMGLRSGYLFSLEEHFRSGFNGDYLVTQVEHQGSQRAGLSIDALDERPDGQPEIVYKNHFVCIPATVQYRPPRETPKPKVPGIMTAEVDGSGDYAYLDDQGRYRAKMHFDQRDRSAGTSSHPIRMKQPYSGKGEAGFHTPSHPGNEMVWACENGDPDRPMALGTAPNPTNKSPVKNENNSQHVIRTTSENEFVIEDQKDQERLELYSPFAKSIVQVGHPGRLLQGIGMSTEKTGELHAKQGIVLKAGGDFKPDASTFEEGIETKQMLLKTIASGVGETLSVKSIKGVHEGFTSAVAEWEKGMEKPGMYLSAEDGIGMNTQKGLTVYTKEGAGVFTDKGIDLVADEGGLQFATDKGGAAVFVRKGGIALRTLQDNVLGRTERGGVKLVAGNVSDPEGVESGDVKSEAKKNIICVAQDENVKLTAESKDVEIEAKKGSQTIKAQKEITIDAGSKITLKCGQASITLKKSGKIEIKGMKIEMGDKSKTQSVKVAGLNVSSEAQVKNDIKGTMVNSKAKGINTVKGSMTKIG